MLEPPDLAWTLGLDAKSGDGGWVRPPGGLRRVMVPAVWLCGRAHAGCWSWLRSSPWGQLPASGTVASAGLLAAPCGIRDPPADQAPTGLGAGQTDKRASLRG